MPRAVRPVKARVSAVSPSPAIASRWAGRGGRLGAEHERGAELRGGGAGGQHGGDAAAGGDPAGGHEREVDRGADELEQREQADLAGRARRRSVAAVPAGLDALDHQRVGARLGRDARLGRRRHRHPGLAEPVEHVAAAGSRR